MTSCLLHGKGNFLTFSYAFPKEKWSNVIFRAATFNISASLNSQLLHLVSILHTPGKRAGWHCMFTAAARLGGNLPFLLTKKDWKTVFYVFSLRTRFRLTSGQPESTCCPLGGWIFVSSFLEFSFLKAEVLKVLSSSDWRPPWASRLAHCSDPLQAEQLSWVGEVEEANREEITLLQGI